MSRTTRLLAVVLLIGVCYPVQAGLGPNGLGPNGLGPNGLGPNGLGPNGLGPNGLGPNGLGPNGLGPNGLGPNGLGPNGLGPNGLDINGLGPNGLGPNGLGPNGVPVWFTVTPNGMSKTAAGAPVTSDFKKWFEADPAGASKYMHYFVRCAYDDKTGVVYLDSTGKTWGWTGQYGFAMASVQTTITDPKLGPVRGRMTLDEGKWVSACLLAHVNVQGSHQYISLRGSPPNPEAQAALMPGINEQWVMGDYKFGAFFGDLFGAFDAGGNQLGNPGTKYACKQAGSANDWLAKSDAVIGRNCDVEQCYYPDPANPAGPQLPVLTEHLGICGFNDYLTPTPLPNGYTFQRMVGSYSVVDPFFWYRVTDMLYGPFSNALADFHPIFVNGPRNVMLKPREGGGFDPNEAAATFDVGYCAQGGNTRKYSPWCTAAEAPFTTPVDLSTQIATCNGTRDCFSGLPTDPNSYKVVGLKAGQALDPTLRFTPRSAGYLGLPGLKPDMSEPFTALIRYRKDRTGSANIWTRTSNGAWHDVTAIGDETRPDIWTPTDPGTWEWMQVYPTYLNYDTLVSTFRGKYCTATSQCAAGLTCDTFSNICLAPAPANNCTDAAPCEAASCPAGQARVAIDAAMIDWAEVGDFCIQQCAAATDCGSGQTCISGQCVSPALKIRLSGSEMSESCSGPELFRGGNEQGQCSKVFATMPPKNGTICPKAFEVLPQCRGKLVWTKRRGVQGWFCRGGEEALYACTPDDAPELDSVAFVPGKPWCAKATDKAFIGVCKDRPSHAEFEEENEVE
jgi:hypothetical protein